MNLKGKAGIVTGSRKHVHPGRIVTSFVMGTERVFDFVDDNPTVEFHPCDRTNDTDVIARNDRVVAINSAIEIDRDGALALRTTGLDIRNPEGDLVVRAPLAVVAIDLRSLLGLSVQARSVEFRDLRIILMTLRVLVHRNAF